jgi:hypothetical protein
MQSQCHTATRTAAALFDSARLIHETWCAISGTPSCGSLLTQRGVVRHSCLCPAWHKHECRTYTYEATLHPIYRETADRLYKRSYINEIN